MQLPADAELRELLARIADLEQRLAQTLTSGSDQAHSPLVNELEAVLTSIQMRAGSFEEILGLLAPAGDGTLALGDREQYGAVRALYWAIVLGASRGVEVPLVMLVLEALPRLHPDVWPQLLDNLRLATLEDRPILDARFLEAILRLRNQHPEHTSLYSSLFDALGEFLSPEERAAFFSIFMPEVEDPVLVGLTLRNLLQGPDPSFGLLLARQRFDDPNLSSEVRAAIAQAVVEHADVFAATEFLAERAQALSGALHLWGGLGIRDGATEALEASYFALVQEDADHRAREAIVSAMGRSRPVDLLRIAESDPAPQVAGQALLTLTASSAWRPSGKELDQALQTLIAGGVPGSSGHRYPQYPWIAGNLMSRARASGRQAVVDQTVAFLLSVVVDPRLQPSERRQSLDVLRPYLPQHQYDTLASGL